MRPVAVIAVAALIVTLTGCASSGTPVNANCDAAASPGNLSNSVTVSGKVGTVPDATFPTPLRSTKVERTLITEGSGDLTETGDLVLFDYTMYEGATGELLSTSFQQGANPGTQLMTEQAGMALYPGMICQTVGSRVVITGPLGDFYGAETAAQATATLGKDVNVVAVVDIVDRIPGRAVGTPQDLPNGFPTVSNTPDGRPGVNVPSAAAPGTLQSATRIESTLPEDEQTVVEANSGLIVQVLNVDWANRSVISNTWQTGAPTQFVSAAELPYIDGLVGKKAGDQVVVVTPGPNASIYVVDILGVFPTQG